MKKPDLNTVLLVVVIALLAALLLKPQAGRYLSLVRGQPYLIDTATGSLVMLDVPAEVRAAYRQWYRPIDFRPLELDPDREQWRQESCPEILVSIGNEPRLMVPAEYFEKQGECEVWQSENWRQDHCPEILATADSESPPDKLPPDFFNRLEECKTWQNAQEATPETRE